MRILMVFFFLISYKTNFAQYVKTVEGTFLFEWCDDKCPSFCTLKGDDVGFRYPYIIYYSKELGAIYEQGIFSFNPDSQFSDSLDNLMISGVTVDQNIYLYIDSLLMTKRSIYEEFNCLTSNDTEKIDSYLEYKKFKAEIKYVFFENKEIEIPDLISKSRLIKVTCPYYYITEIKIK